MRLSRRQLRCYVWPHASAQKIEAIVHVYDFFVAHARASTDRHTNHSVTIIQLANAAHARAYSAAISPAHSRANHLASAAAAAAAVATAAAPSRDANDYAAVASLTTALSVQRARARAQVSINASGSSKRLVWFEPMTMSDEAADR